MAKGETIVLDQQALETTIGISGTMSDDVLKISVPRKDLKVTVDEFEIIPFMGLTSWWPSARVLIRSR